MDRESIAIIDFGGQYAHLIAKRIRHIGVFSRILPPTAPLSELDGVKGLILSGGPQSVYGEGAPPFNAALLSFPGPILGLCYGHQLIAHHLGGVVGRGGRSEYGRAALRLVPGQSTALLEGLPESTEVWMSHGDAVTSPPPGFILIATSEDCPTAAMAHRERPIYGLQFHPEVKDTPEGNRILANFVTITGALKGWNMAAFVEEAVAECISQTGGRNVLMFLSGGVDSTVAFALLTNALGPQRVKGLLIDTGFMRKNEVPAIMERYRALGWDNVELRDAEAEFLAAVEGLTDPQQKREAIGEAFVQVRESYLADAGLEPHDWLLGQGTLYPDIIESGGTQYAEVIKSHHNRVGVIEEMIAAGQVVEPIKQLYKDEVRSLGQTLGLPDELVWRHPFPGPGLAINVLCNGGEGAPPGLEQSNNELQELLKGGPYQGWMLPVRSVGVQGDSRSYTPPAALAGPRDWKLLEESSIRITNSLPEVNRVVALLEPGQPPSLEPRRAYCTADRLELLREADHLATEALRKNGLMREIFQLLVILLPLAPAPAPAGAGECLVLRPVVSEDVMTARFAQIDWNILTKLTAQLMALPNIHAVFYDITHKPPATFGWE